MTGVYKKISFCARFRILPFKNRKTPFAAAGNDAKKQAGFLLRNTCHMPFRLMDGLALPTFCLRNRISFLLVFSVRDFVCFFFS